MGRSDAEAIKAHDTAADVKNSVGVVALCDDASCDVDLSDVARNLNGNHVIASRPDTTADGHKAVR